MTAKVSIRLLAAQSDRRLLELVAGGHERAFEALVQRYRGELLRYCRRMGLSEPRSEDAVQHALLKAWLALERGAEVRELRAWLYRIVHNTAIDSVRRSPEDHGSLTDADSADAAAAVDVGLERRIEVREALTDVAALPPMQREAILLTALEGRSHEEVASALGITDGAVRGLIYRARTTLRGAVAALTPQPLIAWLCGGAAKVAPTAQRLAELSAQGGAGADASGPLFKGAALAVSAVVLAAGAAEVPLHPHAAHQAKTALRSTHAAREVVAVAPAASVGRGTAGHTRGIAGAGSGAPRARKHGGGRSDDAHTLRPERHGGHLRDQSRARATHGELEGRSRTGEPFGERPATPAVPAATLADSDGRGGGGDGASSGSSNRGPQQSGSGGGRSGSEGGGPGVRQEEGSGSGEDSSGGSSDASTSNGSKGGPDDTDHASGPETSSTFAGR